LVFQHSIVQPFAILRAACRFQARATPSTLTLSKFNSDVLFPSTTLAPTMVATRAQWSQNIPQKFEPKQSSSPVATPGSNKTQPMRRAVIQKNQGVKPEPFDHATPPSFKKRNAPSANKTKANPNKSGSHNAKRKRSSEIVIKKEDESPVKKRVRNTIKGSEPHLDHPLDEKKFDSSTAKKPKKSKNYGHTPGVTPFPDYAHPTPDECHEVTRILSNLHGTVTAPTEIRQASLTVAGCGEVPHVLDALVRTRLSANTTNTNSSRAFQGLVSKFGLRADGAGRKTVDWNAVRLADQKDVFEAIKCGGLADRKSKDIIAILQLTYEENQARREALLSKQDMAPGEDKEAEAEKQSEIARAEEDVISLDHIHLLSNEDAFEKLVSYPGIGAKTASCVMLFCLQRPSFAVDTHVWRLCKWLKWVPLNATRDETFSHCEVRVPDELKYPLHKLLISHGKACPRCRAITGENSAGWDEGCVIEKLVTRTGLKKGGSAQSTPRKTLKKIAGNTSAKKNAGGKGRKRDADSEDEDLESEGEMSDLVSDEE
jgi:endonuclease III